MTVYYPISLRITLHDMKWNGTAMNWNGHEKDIEMKMEREWEWKFKLKLLWGNATQIEHDIEMRVQMEVELEV